MEVFLRIGVAFAAGAMLRMLVVFGLPSAISMAALAVAGALLSYKLIASRIFVVICVSLGHFLAFLMTRDAGLTDATDNPSAILLAMNATAIFLPLAMPALGSMVLMQYEKRQAKLAAETKELTEEALLAEALPQVKEVEFDYEAILAKATDPEESSPSPARAADSSDSALPSRG